MCTAQTIFRQALLGLAGLLALLCLGDWAVLRIRALRPTATIPYESIRFTRVLAVPENGGKVEYQIDAVDPEQTVTCVHSLFPHGGYQPCWYVKPKIARPIPLGG